MKTLIMAGAFIETDGRTVWVNDATGCCIGRFSKMGVDVHNTGVQQLMGGKQCLDCIHEGEPAALWERFRGSMLIHHKVNVPEEFRPKYATRAA